MSQTAKKPPNSIGDDEHVFIAGMTGSGKSVLARTYLSGYKTVWKLDIKGEALMDIKKGKDPWPELPNKKKLSIVTRLSHFENVDTPYIIYCPEHDEMDDEYYDMFLRMAYYRQNLKVWIDEAMAVSTNPQHLPPHYKAILTRGRSRDTAIWSLSQRPAGISNTIISQCTHVFSFNLQLPQDRKRVSDITGCPEFLNRPQGHNFWYWRDGWEEAVKAKLALKGGEKNGR